MKKIIFILSLLSFVIGCTTQPKKKTTSPTETGKVEVVEVPKTDSVLPEITSTSPPPAVSTSSPSTRQIPKVGLIFSAGGAKAWAHIGFIKEIEKAKWPIHSVAGFEWGAAVAAVYAHNFSSNEVEWELSKVKDFENLEEIGNSIFSKKSVSDLKIPFVCPSLNISKQMIYLLNRGQLDKLIPFCLAQPPLSPPFLQSVAEMHDIASLAQHLRATGANKIVLINVLSQNSKRSFTTDYLSAENILWVKSAALMAKKINGIDDTVSISLDDFGITDINKKREIIAKGALLSYPDVSRLTKKYGF
ncbi:MAG: patatin-like phospholipase family protein [Bdellovibrionota bacterium]